MEGGDTRGAMLSRELLEAQLGQIDLLTAMYPIDGSVVLSDSSAASLRVLREALDEDSTSPVPADLGDIDLQLQLEIPSEDNGDFLRTVQLSITVPLHYGQVATEETPPARIRLQQPSWMSKAEATNLMAELPKDDNDDLFATIEAITTAASLHHSRAEEAAAAAAAAIPTHAAADDVEDLTRVWFYFPSISTRSKRDDLVRHAPTHGLTGFLLAGKPGLLCVEGSARAVDAYMRVIKTESWGDIPAHHKKVTERYRERLGGPAARAFAEMREITGEMERRGERANRNDMRALEAWLGERGLGEAFAKVLI
ncbi:DUF1115 domain protein [Cordyceps fumosorosea ARSEF 2679]|uniref:DUF1115 domain protein n=1 Tax=Cordyceps fumosorosea (strain ARSEF 2679) TaxID=1081104 RepID=A0A167SY43_CORFA|nr:DUF1115 domain protein [Cordyceps fumosorosea ARSEF 2679]OAA60053.1 DUF1115 domain protein [Cordyceps fumosorosea ARSEF 2679]